MDAVSVSGGAGRQLRSIRATAAVQLLRCEPGGRARRAPLRSWRGGRSGAAAPGARRRRSARALAGSWFGGARRMARPLARLPAHPWQSMSVLITPPLMMPAEAGRGG